MNTHSRLIGCILWIFGFMGAHRFDLGKWLTGLLCPCTAGLLPIGVICDDWTLNGQIGAINAASRARAAG